MCSLLKKHVAFNGVTKNRHHVITTYGSKYARYDRVRVLCEQIHERRLIKFLQRANDKSPRNIGAWRPEFGVCHGMNSEVVERVKGPYCRTRLQG